MIPTALLNSLYTVGSLRSTTDGVEFALKNRLADAEVVGISGMALDGQPVGMDHVRVWQTAVDWPPSEISAANPIPFPLCCQVQIHADAKTSDRTTHKIELAFETRPFGNLKLHVEDALSDGRPGRRSIPRAPADDYSPEIIGLRREFIERETGVALKHIVHHSLDPHSARGNCE